MTNLYALECLPDAAPRQFQTLRHLANGLNYSQIANTMGVSPNTVKQTLHRIKDKVGAENLYHLLALAYQAGIL